MPSIKDLIGQEVDASWADAINRKPVIKSGGHNVRLGKYSIDAYPEWHDGAQAGVEDRIRLSAEFFDEDGASLGRKYFDACPLEFESRYGQQHRDCKLYAQMAHALGVPPGKLDEVLDAIEGAIVNVFGREFFKVPVGEMPEDQREKAIDNGASMADERRVYLDADDDELRSRFIEDGFESDFAIFAIKPAKVLMEG